MIERSFSHMPWMDCFEMLFFCYQLPPQTGYLNKGAPQVAKIKEL